MRWTASTGVTSGCRSVRAESRAVSTGPRGSLNLEGREVLGLDRDGENEPSRSWLSRWVAVLTIDELCLNDINETLPTCVEQLMS